MLDKSLAGCTKIEPSALPLPWAFCRSRNRGGEGDKTRRGGRAIYPASPRFLRRCFLSLAGENAHLSQRHAKALTPRFTVPEVHGCHLACGEGINRPQKANTGFLAFRLCLGKSIGRETLPGNQRSSSSFQNFFEKIVISQRALLLFYAA